MSCYSELAYSLYADHELPPEEAQEVEAHLAACARCRALVEGLRAENLFLAEVMQTPEDELAAAVTPVQNASSLIRIFALLIAVSAGLELVAEWIATLVPGSLSWLDPFGPAVRWTLGFGVMNYLIEEGAAMLVSALTTLGVLVFALLILRAGLSLVQRRPAAIVLLAILALVLGRTAASAAERRTGEVVTVPRDQTVNDSLLAGGEVVNIDGNVVGNLFVWARRVAVKGTVKGDVVVFAQTLDVDGTVEGNVYVFAQFASIRGHVVRGVYSFAEHVQLDSASQVDGELVAASGSTEVRGTIGKHLSAYSGYVGLWTPARVGGDVEAHVAKAKNLFVEPGVVIAGKTETFLPTRRPSRYARPGFYLMQGVRLGAALLTGLVLYWLFPILFAARLDKASSVLLTMGLGFLVLVAPPIAALIAAITLVGLPLALLGAGLWLACLYVAKIFVAALIGQGIRRSPLSQPKSFALDLLIGLAIVFVAINLPYLGGWIRFLVLLLGLGLAFIQARSHWQRVTTPV